MDEPENQDQAKDERPDPPPFFKKWSTMYWVVIGNLALLVILFYLFTKAFS